MRVKAKRTKDTSDTQPETLHWKYKGSQQHLKQMNGKQIVIKSSIFFSSQKFDAYFFGE